MIGFKQKATVAFLAAGLALGNTAHADLLYNITDLGTLGGLVSYGKGINSSGQVTGYSRTANGTDHAFVTNASGVMKDLGVLYEGRPFSIGTGINASGQVVSYSTAINGSPHAVILNSSGLKQDLGALGKIASEGVGISYGFGINDLGQATGYASIHSTFHAFVTNTSGVMSDLGTLGGLESNGMGINNSGQVTGYSRTTNGINHAFVTNASGVMSDLGTSGGLESYGFGINDSGQVTGYSRTTNGTFHAFVTNTSGVMSDLGTLGGLESYGFGINDSGQVTGYSLIANGRQHAFITDNGVITDLNTLLNSNVTGWELNGATAINDLGQITGSGTHNGLTRAFLLTPAAIPVPAAVWLFGSGLCLLAYIGRRKNQIIFAN